MTYKVVIIAGHDHDTWETRKAKGIRTNLESDGVYEEYDSNIVIAKETVNYFKQYDEIKVYFPQENNRKMTLRERVDYCNNVNADTVLFIHSNASGNRNAKGACAFYWHNSPKGKRFAEFYAEEMEKAGYPLWSNGTYPCTPNTWSEFYVVKNTNMPVLLTENFFFTNPTELKEYLLNERHLKNIANIHVIATLRYLGIEYKEEEKEINFEEFKEGEQLYRLKTGTFDSADSFDRALDTLKNHYNWKLYEKAESLNFNPRYRIITGTMPHETAKKYAKELKDKFGWTVYVVKA